MRPLRLPLLAALFAAALALGSGPAAAQGFDMAKGGDSQIQVYADNGIDWQSDAHRVIAHGNAKAVRGDMTVTADTLTAYYRQGPTGGNEIYRLDADGNVTITNPSDVATGVKGIYDLDKAVFVLHGNPAKLVTPTAEFTAVDALEYWEQQRLAVLRGHGTAVERAKAKTLAGDVVTAHFVDKSACADKPAAGKGKSAAGKGGSKPATCTDKPAAAKPAAGGGKPVHPGADAEGGALDLERADAYGHVVLTTAEEVVTGDRGDYNAETGIATVSGSVKITREGNELDGGYAYVDLNTGISKLFGGVPGGTGDQRARGTFVPEKKDKDKDAGQPQSVFQGSAPQPKDETGGAAAPPGGSGGP